MAGAINAGLPEDWLGAATWSTLATNISAVSPGRVVYHWPVSDQSVDTPIGVFGDIIGEVPEDMPLREYFASSFYSPTQYGDVPW